MVRRVKAYLGKMKVITDEDKLHELSLVCEGGTVAAPSAPAQPRKYNPSPTLSTASSTSSASEGRRTTAPKFGAYSNFEILNYFTIFCHSRRCRFLFFLWGWGRRLYPFFDVKLLGEVLKKILLNLWRIWRKFRKMLENCMRNFFKMLEILSLLRDILEKYFSKIGDILEKFFEDTNMKLIFGEIFIKFCINFKDILYKFWTFQVFA